MMRKAIIAASVAALLIVLYGAAGYWLAPRYLHDALVERAARLGLGLELGELRTHPFLLTVTVQGLRVLAGGRELAHAERLDADLAWRSLWSGTWRVQHAALRAPRAEVVLGREGELNWPAARGGNGGTRNLGFVVEQVSISDGALRFVDRSRAAPVEVQFEAINAHASNLSTLAGERATYELQARTAQGGRLGVEGGLTLEPIAAQGRVDLAEVPLATVWRLAAPASDPGSGAVHGSAGFTYDGGKVAFSDVVLEGSGLAYEGAELPRLVLRSPRIPLPLREAIEVSGEAALAREGRVSAAGTVGFGPFTAELQAQAEGVPLEQVNRWMPESVPVRIASGTAAAEGRISVGPQGARFDGALAARDGRIEQRGSGDLLLAWQSLSTEEAALAFAPFRAELGEVLAQAPRGRLVIGEGGELNVAAVFKGQEKEGDGPPPQVEVRRLRIEEGVLQFADRSLDNDFAVTVAELGGTLSGLSTEPGDPARVQLKGRVGEYGAARIGGTVNLDAPSALTDIRATLRNLDLAELTPYVVRFAGYRVESGRVSAKLRYRVREGRLVGENDLTFERLQLGEKVRRAGAADLPLELAVALLADAKGRIDLDIPVSGNLNDPQFDFGGLVARALGNVIGKIVSAPFRVLAGVLGGDGGDLDRVAFAPGSASLSPPAEEAVANVAKALAGRPRLNVAVQGGYDPQADVEALRRQTARRAIAQRAGVEPEKPLDYGDPRVLQAAERLYLERVGNRLQMQALREEAPRYGQTLLERLAATMQVDAQSAEKLARARAEMVRAELLSHGIEPSRVRLDAPEGRESGKDGVPTVLALGAGGGAAAGGTR